MKQSLIEEARQKILETALALKHALEFVNAMSIFGHAMFDDYNPEGPKFREGLGMMRDAIANKYARTLANAFMFTGVSDGLKDLSLEILREKFSDDERQMVMQFLEQWGNVPRSWIVEEEKTFREEVKEKIKPEPTIRLRRPGSKNAE